MIINVMFAWPNVGCHRLLLKSLSNKWDIKYPDEYSVQRKYYPIALASGFCYQASEFCR